MKVAIASGKGGSGKTTLSVNLAAYMAAGVLPMAARRTGELHHLNACYLQFIEGKLDVGQVQAVPVVNRTVEYLKDQFQELDTEATI